MKDVKILISSLFIFISFFMGFFVSQKKSELEIEKIKKEKYIINIEKTKTKLNIVNTNKNVIIKLNGEDMAENSLYLK